jgi:hypothetical protein
MAKKLPLLLLAVLLQPAKSASAKKAILQASKLSPQKINFDHGLGGLR